MPPENSADVVLSVNNIITRFNTAEGTVHAVNGVSFDVHEGELLGVVGESGCGKSVTMMSLVKLIPMPPARIVEGSALFEDKDLIQMDLEALQDIRGAKIGFIFQDPMTSLNPVLTVGYQLTEALRLHMGLSNKAARARAVEILELVGIPQAEKRLSDYPHQFSGGMRQRVMIAIALSCDPKVLIADEPTTALDPQARHTVWGWLQSLKGRGLTMLLTTHDMEEAERLCDRLCVIDHGKQLLEGEPEVLVEQHVGVATIEVRAASGDTPKEVFEGLANLEQAGGSLLAHFNDEEEARTSLNRALDAGLRANLRRATLEDLFLKLTGRALRQ